MPSCFPESSHYFIFSPAVCEGSSFLIFLSTLVFFIIAILVDGKYYLIVDLICPNDPTDF